MSFKKSSSSKIKSFVTEDEAQDINEKRQKEWERVRQPEDPLGKKYKCLYDICTVEITR